MIPTNKFPYTDFHEINLNWVIERIQEMYTIIDQKIFEALAPVIADINELTGRVTVNENNISQLFTRMTRAEGNINDINNSVETFTEDIRQINGVLGAFNQHFINVDTSIEELETVTGTHTAQITDIYNKIADIDPESSLVVDATDFNIEDKTASILDTVYQFYLKGNDRNETFTLYPDLIPGTQSGYYSRVTMQSDPVTNKVKLPSELTTGTLPIIRRGTYAVNVNKSAEVYNGDPLEYSINGDVFTVDGFDANAIILMCIACLHRGANEYENVTVDNGVEVVHGVPATSVNSNYTRYEGELSVPSGAPIYGLARYAYFFDISGNLLEFVDLDSETPLGSFTIPAGTYSIWYGIGTTDDHEAWTNNTFKVVLPTTAGAYYVEDDNFVSRHRVTFDYQSSSVGSTYWQTAEKIGGIYGLLSYDTINMFTGDIERGGYPLPSLKFNVNNILPRLEPDLNYTVTLDNKESGYTEAVLKYNKIMVILNDLNANNTRY